MVFGCVLPAILIKVDQKKLFCAVFDKKNLIFEIFSQNFGQKKFKKIASNFICL